MNGAHMLFGNKKTGHQQLTQSHSKVLDIGKHDQYSSVEGELVERADAHSSQQNQKEDSFFARSALGWLITNDDVERSNSCRRQPISMARQHLIIAFMVLLLLLASLTYTIGYDEKKVAVVVEGMVYCLSCKHQGEWPLTEAKPIPLAKVSVTCEDHQNRAMFYKVFPTNEDRYFYDPSIRARLMILKKEGAKSPFKGVGPNILLAGAGMLPGFDKLFFLSKYG